MKFYFPIVIGVLLAICHSIFLFQERDKFYSKQNFIQNYEHPISCTVTLIKKNVSSFKLTFRNLKVMLEIADHHGSEISFVKIQKTLHEMKDYLSILPEEQTHILGEPAFFFRDCTDDTRPIVEMTIDQIQKELDQNMLLTNQVPPFSPFKVMALLFFYIINILIYTFFARTYEKKQ
ncbi:hypothetical protein [Bacteriovorax sp. BSW11_IV]|uniref:hypothetical protein n=1 Tax=Bacteriovorax sp. BSW11_IV TaxID=1353529 RepID=UPI0005576B4E|nr:hypothetical protein [Bacteriovorax sp. BSW11_IV]